MLMGGNLIQCENMEILLEWDKVMFKIAILSRSYLFLYILRILSEYLN
jgi:hypothetical protein